MRTYLALLPFSLAACGSDPVSYSAPVGIELKAKSGDVTNATVSDDKAINTESGNPYGAFVSDAQHALGGHDPSRIEVDGVTLLLGAGSTGVTSLGEIFDGEVDIQFQMNDTNDTFPVASTTIDANSTGGPIEMDVAFDSGTVGANDFPQLLAGSFKVSVRGPAAADFATKGADANLQATFTFAAFE